MLLVGQFEVEDRTWGDGSCGFHFNLVNDLSLASPLLGLTKATIWPHAKKENQFSFWREEAVRTISHHTK